MILFQLLAGILSLLSTSDTTGQDSPASDLFGSMEGCWQVDGVVQGKPARNLAKVSPRLGGRYSLLELHGLDPADPYDAAIIMAPDEKPGSIVGYWLDSFGGAFSTSGRGRVEKDGMAIDFVYPDATFINQFSPEGEGWRWSIINRSSSGSESLFARYTMMRTSCEGFRSVF